MKKKKVCYEQLYAHKFDNLDETVQFFERHNLPRVTQEKITLKQSE